jgi:hypothetical protein
LGGRLRDVCGLCEVSFLHMALPRRGFANVPLNRAVRGYGGSVSLMPLDVETVHVKFLWRVHGAAASAAASKKTIRTPLPVMTASRR